MRVVRVVLNRPDDLFGQPVLVVRDRHHDLADHRLDALDSERPSQRLVLLPERANVARHRDLVALHPDLEVPERPVPAQRLLDRPSEGVARLLPRHADRADERERESREPTGQSADRSRVHGCRSFQT